MCGIIAYQGRHDARRVLWQGLRELEYRGYDSWGIGLFTAKKIKLWRRVGKISEVSFRSLAGLPQTRGGMGHTRWATHGGVTPGNAHPQLSQSGRVAVVHNGIVENFGSLKKELIYKGYSFKSTTDTEVIADLIEDYAQKQDFVSAVLRTAKRLKGRNAFVAYHCPEQQWVGVRLGSPLVFGTVAHKDFFLASDVAAFARFRPEIRSLKDGELVAIEDQRVSFYRAGRFLKKPPRLHLLDFHADKQGKGDFPHFMVKEIKEQERTLVHVLQQKEKSLQGAIQTLQQARKIFLTGAGTAGRVCHFGEYLFGKICQKQAVYLPASEFHHFAGLLDREDGLVVISQSGETADTLEAVAAAQDQEVPIIALVNVAHSSLAQSADYTLLTQAGTERAVASTKATTAQIALLILLAFGVWEHLGEARQMIGQLQKLIRIFFQEDYEEQIRSLARKLQDCRDLYILGRGAEYPIALEAAIKLQEVGYIHAQGFAGGELKHGPLALIEKGVPVIVLTDAENSAEILSNAQEVKSRGGMVIGISAHQEAVFDYWLKVPERSILQPILSLIPLQLLAYHLAVLRGINPDLPRNLAKSVTVK